MNAAGDFVVAWQSYGQDGSSFGVYARRYAVPVAAPTIRINDGSAQRSKVTEITLTFDQNYVFDPGYLTLTGRNGAGAGMPVATFNDSGDSRTFQIRFSGDPIVGGSLADGVYDLLVAANKVHVLTGQTVDRASGLAADAKLAFHRLYSDADGDGNSDNFDLLQLRPTLLKPSTDPAYRAYFDYDASGAVDNLDVFQVRSRRGIVFQGY